MKYSLIILISVFLLLLPFNRISSQEINAKLTINTSKLQGVNKDIFTNMQSALLQFMNERQWTDASFARNERIDCTFVLTISEMPAENSFVGDLQISSRRPVFSSTYTSPLFNFKDVEISFEYNDGQTLDLNESNIDNNLVAIFSYYTYIVLGLDFDSFSLAGGKPYFNKAMTIANSAQMLKVKGWTPFDSDKNRYALASALTEENSNFFHTMWYNYHRLGLDEMASNTTRGRSRIITSLTNLQEIYSARPSSPIILFYGDTKLAELIDVYSQATKEERTEAYGILRKIYPSKMTQLDALRK